jgi:hypothetical protein
MRGANYLWSDGEYVHIWSADGYDGWDESGWAAHLANQEPTGESRPRPSGVSLALETADEFAAMHFAQTIEDRRLCQAILRTLEKHSGNGGCLALRQLSALLNGLEAPS